MCTIYYVFFISLFCKYEPCLDWISISFCEKFNFKCTLFFNVNFRTFSLWHLKNSKQLLHFKISIYASYAFICKYFPLGLLKQYANSVKVEIKLFFIIIIIYLYVQHLSFLIYFMLLTVNIVFIST